MNKIYVGNLPYRMSEEDLRAVFSKYGTIVNIALIKDLETGRLKGFGFIEFENQAAAQAALEMDGKDFQGRPLKVNMAKEKERTSGGGGGGNSRGGKSRSRW